MYDPDAWRFREYAEGHTNDSPVDLSGREGAPRTRYCIHCETEAITERDAEPYCQTCSDAYDAGEAAGYKHGKEK